MQQNIKEVNESDLLDLKPLTIEMCFILYLLIKSICLFNNDLLLILIKDLGIVFENSGILLPEPAVIIIDFIIFFYSYPHEILSL